MKLDTSSYYPKPLLEEDENDTSIVSVAEVIAEVRDEREAPDTQDMSSQNNEGEKPTARKGGDKDSGESDGERAVDIFATAISWLFVPLFMPVYGILLAFSLSILKYTPEGVKTVFVIITAIFNMFIPMVLIYLLKRMGIVQDIGLNNRSERYIPYIITALCMGGTGIFMAMKHAPMWFAMFFVGGAVTAVINLVINTKWKISAHSAGIAGIVALLVRIMHDGYPSAGVMDWLMVSIIIAGLLGASRIWLGRHTLMQVLAGFAVGFFAVFFITMIQ